MAKFSDEEGEYEVSADVTLNYSRRLTGLRGIVGQFVAQWGKKNWYALRFVNVLDIAMA